VKGFPKDCRVFQLPEGSKTPQGGHGHLSSESIEYFVPTNPNVALVLGDEADSQYVCLDIDYPRLPLAVELMGMASKAPTMTQDTPHGHQWVWIAPKGFPRLRAALKGPNGTVGELLSHGYIVGPGSIVTCNGNKHGDGKSCGTKTYKRTNDVEPAMAPPWVVALATELSGNVSKGADISSQSKAKIPLGSHDKFMADTAYNLRRWSGLDEQAIKDYFRAGGLQGAISALEGYNPASPFTQVDIDRWAASAVKSTPSMAIVGVPHIPQDSEFPKRRGFTSGSDTPMIGAPVKWWVRGFVPQEGLTMLFGAGGLGKSTFGSWLATEVTRLGANFGVVCVEESPTLFMNRAVMGGADRSKIRLIDDPASWVIPRDIEELEAAILAEDLKFLWMDSVYSHFEHIEGMNIAERARKTLGPVEAMARRTKCAIMGVFHENASGKFLGAQEMENVPRLVLRATRNLAKSKSPLKIRVKKTNLHYCPDFYLRFEADMVVLADSITGEVQMEETEPGKLEPLRVPIARRIENTPIEEEEMEATIEAAANVSAKTGRIGNM